MGNVEDVKVGIAVYQKKPEFGPARLEVGKYTLENVGQTYLIERGSTLKLGDLNIKGE
jgi:hypothetical protein